MTLPQSHHYPVIDQSLIFQRKPPQKVSDIYLSKAAVNVFVADESVSKQTDESGKKKKKDKKKGGKKGKKKKKGMVFEKIQSTIITLYKLFCRTWTGTWTRTWRTGDNLRASLYSKEVTCLGITFTLILENYTKIDKGLYTARRPTFSYRRYGG